jgi:Holliday junction resolvase RusA-like endonuclease
VPHLVYRTGVPSIRRTNAVALDNLTATAPLQHGQRLLVHVVVAGEPVAKARPRVVRTGAYTPRKTLDAEARLLGHLKVQYPRLRPATGLLSVSVETWHKGAPRVDVDNLLKLVLDAFNRVVWVDDSQVVEAHVRKHVRSSLPRTDIHVWLVGEDR